ncbi:MAG: hypothetical protein ACE5JP_12885 [Candidatus Bipolaricaulia bacterium]
MNTRGRFLIQTEVGKSLIIETTQFEASYATFLRRRRGGRILKLENYTNEGDARAGHRRWVRHAWEGKPTIKLVEADNGVEEAEDPRFDEATVRELCGVPDPHLLSHYNITDVQEGSILHRALSYAFNHYPQANFLDELSFGSLVEYFVTGTGYSEDFGTEESAKEQRAKRAVVELYREYRGELSTQQLTVRGVSLLEKHLLKR